MLFLTLPWEFYLFLKFLNGVCIYYQNAVIVLSWLFKFWSDFFDVIFHDVTRTWWLRRLQVHRQEHWCLSEYLHLPLVSSGCVTSRPKPVFYSPFSEVPLQMPWYLLQSGLYALSLLSLWTRCSKPARLTYCMHTKCLGLEEALLKWLNDLNSASCVLLCAWLCRYL